MLWSGWGGLQVGFTAAVCIPACRKENGPLPLLNAACSCPDEALAVRNPWESAFIQSRLLCRATLLPCKGVQRAGPMRPPRWHAAQAHPQTAGPFDPTACETPLRKGSQMEWCGHELDLLAGSSSSAVQAQRRLCTVMKTPLAGASVRLCRIARGTCICCQSGETTQLPGAGTAAVPLVAALAWPGPSSNVWPLKMWTKAIFACTQQTSHQPASQIATLR